MTWRRRRGRLTQLRISHAIPPTSPPSAGVYVPEDVQAVATRRIFSLLQVSNWHSEKEEKVIYSQSGCSQANLYLSVSQW